MGLGGVNGGVGGIGVGPFPLILRRAQHERPPDPLWTPAFSRMTEGAGMIELVLKGFNGGERWASALDSSRSLGMTG